MNWVVFHVWIRVGGLVVRVDVLYHDFICVGVWTWRCFLEKMEAVCDYGVVYQVVV